MRIELIDELLRNAAAGDVVQLPPGNYPVARAHTFPAVTDVTIDARGVRFDETEFIAGGSLLAMGWLGVTWLGGKISGVDSEDELLKKVRAARAAGRELTYAELGAGLVVAGVDTVIDGLATERKDRGIVLLKPDRVRVRHCEHSGHYSGISKFFPAGHDQAGQLDPDIKDLVRLTYGVMIAGGLRTEVRDCWSDHAGGAVVAGSSLDGTPYGLPRGLSITRVTGDLLGDNGIYLSSAQRGTVERCEFSRVTGGFAAKARGSLNTITRCTSLDSHAGFMLEGAGKDVDAMGANGYGSSIEQCRVIGARDFAIVIDEHQGNFPRHCRLSHNQVIDSLHAPEFFPKSLVERAAFFLRGGQYLTIDGNTVLDTAGDAWLVLGEAQANITGTRVGADNQVHGNNQAIRVGGALRSLPEGGLRF